MQSPDIVDYLKILPPEAKQLDLSNRKLSPIEWGAVAVTLKSHTDLEEVILKNTNLNGQYFDIISPALQNCKNLTKLHLQNNKFAGINAELLQKLIFSLPKLNEIMISNCDLSREQTDILILTMALKPSIKVSDLEIRDVVTKCVFLLLNKDSIFKLYRGGSYNDLFEILFKQSDRKKFINDSIAEYSAKSICSVAINLYITGKKTNGLSIIDYDGCKTLFIPEKIASSCGHYEFMEVSNVPGWDLDEPGISRVIPRKFFPGRKTMVLCPANNLNKPYEIDKLITKRQHQLPINYRLTCSDSNDFDSEIWECNFPTFLGNFPIFFRFYSNLHASLNVEIVPSAPQLMLSELDKQSDNFAKSLLEIFNVQFFLGFKNVEGESTKEKTDKVLSCFIQLILSRWSGPNGSIIKQYFIEQSTIRKFIACFYQAEDYKAFFAENREKTIDHVRIEFRYILIKLANTEGYLKPLIILKRLQGEKYTIEVSLLDEGNFIISINGNIVGAYQLDQKLKLLLLSKALEKALTEEMKKSNGKNISSSNLLVAPSRFAFFKDAPRISIATTQPPLSEEFRYS